MGEMNENKTKIFLSAETEMCPYWDTESNRPKHTCHDCAEPDNHLSVMIEGVRYCLLDFDIAGEICRGNVPDTNVGKKEYIDRQAAIDAVREQLKKAPTAAIRAMHVIKSLEPSDVVPVVRCRDCREFAKASHWCESFDNPTGEDDFCSYGERREE